MIQILSPEECLAKALECEEIAAKLSASGGGDAMLEAAVMWRRLGAGELNPRTDSDSVSTQEELAAIDERSTEILRQRADQYSKLATAIDDAQTKNALLEIVAQLELRAEALSDEISESEGDFG